MASFNDQSMRFSDLLFKTYLDSNRIVDTSKVCDQEREMSLENAKRISNEKEDENDLISLLERVQCNRLEDQRSTFPSALMGRPFSQYEHTFSVSGNEVNIEEIFKNPGPYPMIIKVRNSQYKLEMSRKEDCLSLQNLSGYGLEVERESIYFRTHFLNKDHMDYYGYCDKSGPVLLSLKVEKSSIGEITRVIFRKSCGIVCETKPIEETGLYPSPTEVAQKIDPHLSLEGLYPIVWPGGSELILQYDEQCISRNFKFGIIYQKFGQMYEEEMFSNRYHGESFEDFLQLLGTRVELKGFKGFRGGLDTKSNQTGIESVHTSYRGHEIMFHVSTFLPFTDGDAQQLQKKRHIGNDIVAIIYQEENTPFCPDMIASHFLHCFIVVQPLDQGRQYKVSVTSRGDVPSFGPPLPMGQILKNRYSMRDFLLTKLINAELACYKASKFAALQKRTKSELLSNLYGQLKAKNDEYIGISEDMLADKNNSINVLDNFKRAIKLQPIKSRLSRSSDPVNDFTDGSKRSQMLINSGISSILGDDILHPMGKLEECLIPSTNTAVYQRYPKRSHGKLLRSMDKEKNNNCKMAIIETDKVKHLDAKVTKLIEEKNILLQQIMAYREESLTAKSIETKATQELACAQKEICTLKLLLLNSVSEAMV